MTNSPLEIATHKHYLRNQRWGFSWALWTAVLWGAWYIPGTAVWFESPYVDIDINDSALRLSATAVMTWIHAIMVFLFLLIWNGMLGKLADYGRTIVRLCGPCICCHHLVILSGRGCRNCPIMVQRKNFNPSGLGHGHYYHGGYCYLWPWLIRYR